MKTFEQTFNSWNLDQKVEWILGPKICNLTNNARSIIVDLKEENQKLKQKIADDYIEYQNKTQVQAKRIAELEAENARLKEQVPKWHDLTKPLYVDENGNDVWDLPNEDESHNDEVYTLHKCGCYGTEQWDEIDPEVIAMWCELPTAPSTTEESSATEKENG